MSRQTRDLVRATDRELSQSQRGLDRELGALQKKEKELTVQLKKYAALGQTARAIPYVAADF